MKRRKFLIGTGSAAIGGSALVGSGAFSRVESQRGVTIQVAEDPDAYLGLDGCPGSANSSYTEIDEKGHLAIQMNPDNETDAGGQGVNSDSISWFDNVFQICNQGKEKVCVYIEDHDDWPVVDDDNLDGDYSAYDGERRVDFYVGDERHDSLVGMPRGFGIEVGECVCVGIRTLTKGLGYKDESLLDDLGDEITLVADVGLDCRQTTVEEEYTATQVDFAWGDPLFTIDSEENVTYSNQKRLLAWQHGDGDANETPDYSDWAGENGNRFADDGLNTLGFGRLFESMDAIRFLDENGNVVTETDSGLNVSRGGGLPTPVTAEVEFTMVDDFDDQKEDLKDDIEDWYDAGDITEEEHDRAMGALNGSVDVSFTSYGGETFGWNPPEFQILHDAHMAVSSSGTYTLEVELPDLE